MTGLARASIKNKGRARARLLRKIDLIARRAMSDDNLHRLPDQLRLNLRLVFVGTAASTMSASVGHYYAHPGNRFWQALHEVGITSRRHQPSEFASLLALGIGFTDLSKTGAGMDHQIVRQSFDIAGFNAKIQAYRPRTIAFTSKKAASLFYNKPTTALSLGRQPSTGAFPETFVLSSPSGAASGHWTLQPWRELAEWIKRAEQSAK
jgi:double-stranded uracil-DNA glycosylase